MANVHTEQILLDGDRNVFVKCVGVLDTSNQALIDIVLPASLVPVPTLLRIDEIEYSITDQLSVQILWKATTDVVAVVLAGRGELCAKKQGGLINNAGVGVNGIIRLQTTGWASGTQTYTLLLKLVKQGV